MNKEWSALNKLVKKQEELYHQCAARAGITDTKFWILYGLFEAGGVLSQNSFCENWFYSKQTVNAAVSGLEEEGILYLEFAAGSKKQKNLKLTARGRTFCEAHIRPVLDPECRPVLDLGEREQEMVRCTLEKLLSALENALTEPEHQ